MPDPFGMMTPAEYTELEQKKQLFPEELTSRRIQNRLQYEQLRNVLADQEAQVEYARMMQGMTTKAPGALTTTPPTQMPQPGQAPTPTPTPAPSAQPPAQAPAQPQALPPTRTIFDSLPPGLKESTQSAFIDWQTQQQKVNQVNMAYQSAAKTANIHLINIARANLEQEQKELKSAEDRFNSSLLRAKDFVTTAGAAQKESDRAKLREDYSARHPELGGDLSKIDAGIAAEQAGARTLASMEARKKEILGAYGPKGLDIAASKTLFLGQDPRTFDPIVAAEVNNRAGDMLSKLPQGLTLAALRSTVKGQMDAIDGQSKWVANVQNRMSFLDGMLPQIEEAFERIPRKYQNEPVTKLQQIYLKNIEGNEPLGTYLTMATEAAKEYNAMIMGGPTGAAGSAGGVVERLGVQDFLDPAQPPKTFIGSMKGIRKGSEVRLKGLEKTLNSLIGNLDRTTGGHASDLQSPNPSAPPAGTVKDASQMTDEELMADYRRRHPEGE